MDRLLEYFKRHLAFLLTTLLIAIGLTTTLSIKQHKQNQFNALKSEVLEIKWPPLKSEMQKQISLFDDISAKRPISRKEIKPLNDCQDKWIKLTSEYPGIYFPEGSILIEKLESRISNHLSNILLSESIIAEQIAKQSNLEIKDNRVLALEKMKEALDLQRQINDDFPQSNLVNYPRYLELKAWIHEKEAVPIYNKILKHIELGERLARKNALQNSILAYERAILFQQEINENYPEAPQVSVTRVLDLENKIHETEALIIFEKSKNNESKAKELIDSNQNPQAIELLQKALVAQNELNLNFPHTLSANSDRSTELSSLIQSLQASKLIEELKNLDNELDLLISVEMGDELIFKIENLLEKFSQVENDFSLAPNIPLEIKYKANYLQTIAQSISLIKQDLTDNNLNDLEGTQKKYSSPIKQNLFELIMGNNPSRTIDPTGFVESVNYEEALLFCKRLEWATTLKVEIPNLESMLKIRRLENDGYTRSEWIQEPAKPDEAKIFAPSGLTYDVKDHKRAYRSRNLHFRIVVEQNN